MITIDDIQRYKDVITAVRDRLITMTADNMDAPPVLRDALADMIVSCRTFERRADYVITELQRTGGRA